MGLANPVLYAAIDLPCSNGNGFQGADYWKNDNGYKGGKRERGQGKYQSIANTVAAAGGLVFSHFDHKYAV
jgi:hypothetical protein